jgi:PAS domain-containing protein
MLLIRAFEFDQTLNNLGGLRLPQGVFRARLAQQPGGLVVLRHQPPVIVQRDNHRLDFAETLDKIRTFACQVAQGENMTDPTLLAAILDSLKDPILFADTDHIIRYMNKAAIATMPTRSRRSAKCW